jgi:hypothetical protein
VTAFSLSVWKTTNMFSLFTTNSVCLYYCSSQQPLLTGMHSDTIMGYGLVYR